MFSPSPLFIGIGLLHALACLATLTGFVFLLAFAIKKLSDEKLKNTGMILFLVGVIVCLATAVALPFHGYGMMHDRGASECMMMGGTGQKECMMKKEMKGMMEKKMGMMMQDDEMKNEHEMMDPMTMSMTDMSAMLKGKTGTEFDIAFVEGMIPHHQGAIDMAMEARKSAGHAEIKKMAEDIISAQQKEIDMMNAWLKEWTEQK